MNRVLATIAPALAVVVIGWAASAHAEDAPIPAPDWLRTLVSEAIHRELALHDSPETAWTNERVESRRRRVGLAVARWTRTTKSTVYLDDPDQNLNIDLRRLDIQGNRLDFLLVAYGRAKFIAEVDVSRLPPVKIKGEAHGHFVIEGHCHYDLRGLSEAQITELDGRLHGVKFSNDIIDAFRGTIRNVLNRSLDRRYETLKPKLEAAINKVRLVR